MVPRLSIISCRDMPMPSSAISRVRACLSGTTRIFASAGGASLASVSASNRRRSTGVGGVGHQFAQKYLPLGVKRVDDQIQQSPDFGTKSMFFQYGIVHAHLLAPRYMRSRASNFNAWAHLYRSHRKADA